VVNVEGDTAIKPEGLTFDVFERRDRQVMMKEGKTTKEVCQRVGERKKGEGGIVPRAVCKQYKNLHKFTGRVNKLLMQTITN